MVSCSPFLGKIPLSAQLCGSAEDKRVSAGKGEPLKLLLRQDSYINVNNMNEVGSLVVILHHACHPSVLLGPDPGIRGCLEQLGHRTRHHL